MVVALTVWILLKALFFVVLIFGPLALIGLAVETHLKKTEQGTYVAAIIKVAAEIMVILLLGGAFLWLAFHHQLHPADWLQCLVPIAVIFGLVQDWSRVRKLSEARRQARVLAESDEGLPSGFHYEQGE